MKHNIAKCIFCTKDKSGFNFCSVNCNINKNIPIQKSSKTTIIGVFTREDFKKIANDFLVQTEKDDKDKMPWETRNHIPILHQSINEFYKWMDKNYW